MRKSRQFTEMGGDDKVACVYVCVCVCVCVCVRVHAKSKHSTAMCSDDKIE